MALKKSQLYSSLWESCNLLCGGMDASQYKDYVLVLLFIKYVSDKYAGVPYAPIHGEMDRISQALTRRVKELAERYATPLPKLSAEVDILAARVDGHLKKMGFRWNVARNNADKQRV